MPISAPILRVLKYCSRQLVYRNIRYSYGLHTYYIHAEYLQGSSTGNNKYYFPKFSNHPPFLSRLRSLVKNQSSPPDFIIGISAASQNSKLILFVSSKFLWYWRFVLKMILFPGLFFLAILKDSFITLYPKIFLILKRSMCTGGRSRIGKCFYINTSLGYLAASGGQLKYHKEFDVGLKSLNFVDN